MQAKVSALLTRKTSRTRLQFSEVIRNVTTFAHLAKSAIVNIFIGMATHAGKRHAKCLLHRLPVAIQTANFQMGTIQLVFGAAIMIKVP